MLTCILAHKIWPSSGQALKRAVPVLGLGMYGSCQARPCRQGDSFTPQFAKTKKKKMCITLSFFLLQVCPLVPRSQWGIERGESSSSDPQRTVHEHGPVYGALVGPLYAPMCWGSENSREALSWPIETSLNGGYILTMLALRDQNHSTQSSASCCTKLASVFSPDSFQ